MLPRGEDKGRAYDRLSELCKGKGALHTRKSLIGQFELKQNLIPCNSVISETLNLDMPLYIL